MYNLPDNFDHDRDMIYEPHEKIIELFQEPGDDVSGISELEAWLQRELIKHAKKE